MAPDAVSCPVSDYHTGGPDYMSDQTINRYQGRSVLSYMFEGLGHHVLKTGVDLELMTYENVKGYSGGRSFVEGDDGSYFVDGRQYGYLTGPDQAVVLDSIHNKSKSVTLGGFIQDSWSVMDVVTLNFGMRYDAQLLYAGDGTLAMALPKQWSPRAGVIYDFTRDGRSKVYANYARYYQSVPLDVMDRTATGELGLLGARRCTCNRSIRASSRTRCLADANRPAAFDPPNSLYGRGWCGAGRQSTPRSRRPPATSSWWGAESRSCATADSASATRSAAQSTIEDMSRDEAQTYFLGNPGHGIARDFTKAERSTTPSPCTSRRPSQGLAGTGQLHRLCAARKLCGPVPRRGPAARPVHELGLRPALDDGDRRGRCPATTRTHSSCSGQGLQDPRLRRDHPRCELPCSVGAAVQLPGAHRCTDKTGVHPAAR